MIGIIRGLWQEHAPIVRDGLVGFFNFDVTFAIVVSLGFALYSTVFSEPLLATALVVAMLIKIVSLGFRFDYFTHVRPLLMPFTYEYSEFYIVKASMIKVARLVFVMSLWVNVFFVCCILPDRRLTRFELQMILLIPFDLMYAWCVGVSEVKYIELQKLRNKKDKEEPHE